MRTNELILYKDMEDGELLQDMTFLMENYNNEYYNEDDMKSLLYSTIGDLTELSVSHGFEGNLWHTYLTYLMVSHENAYSTSCEIVGPVEGSINIAALHDFKIFKELFDYDFQNLGEVLGEDGLAMIRNYKGVNGHGQVFNERIRDRICDLAKALDGTKCAEEFKEKVTQFYKEFGVGKLGLHMVGVGLGGNWGFTKHFVLSIPKKGQESCRSQRLLMCTWVIWWDTRWQRKN